jgi:hypothetical protein
MPSTSRRASAYSSRVIPTISQVLTAYSRVYKVDSSPLIDIFTTPFSDKSCRKR